MYVYDVIYSSLFLYLCSSKYFYEFSNMVPLKWQMQYQKHNVRIEFVGNDNAICNVMELMAVGKILMKINSNWSQNDRTVPGPDWWDWVQALFSREFYYQEFSYSTIIIFICNRAMHNMSPIFAIYNAFKIHKHCFIQLYYTRG